MKTKLTIGIIILGLSVSSFWLRHSQDTTSNLVQAQTGECTSQDTVNWCQLQRDPQRTGRSPASLSMPLANKWAKSFTPERLGAHVQPIVAGGKIYIGTQMGTFYALNATTGANVWTFNTGVAIESTAGYSNGRVFIATMQGDVYALNADTGQQIWKYTTPHFTGFSASILLVQDRLYLNNRGGTVYAFNQSDGSIAWQQQLPADTLMSPTYDNGKIFVAGMDMRLYALSESTGSVSWTSPQLPGAALKDYWPVAHQGQVIVRSYPQTREKIGSFPLTWNTGPLPQSEIDKQANLISLYEGTSSHLKTMFVVNQTSGQESYVVPHWTVNTHNGPIPPPSIDQSGHLIVPVSMIKPDNNWGGSGWGRLDLGQRRVIEVLIDDQRYGGDQRAFGTGNDDENMYVTTAGQHVLTFHTQEGNAHFTGIWDQNSLRWNYVHVYSADQVYWNNNQRFGASPAIIANDYVYHVTLNTLNARQ